MPDINHGLRRVFYVRQRKQTSLCYYDHGVLHGVTPLNPLNISPPPSPPFKGPLLDKKHHVPHLLHCSMLY